MSAGLRPTPGFMLDIALITQLIDVGFVGVSSHVLEIVVA
jgi:hypothetical protein